MMLSKTGFLEALPPLVGYARRRWDTADTHRLIALVEQVCKKLDEEEQRSKVDVAQLVEDDISFGHRGIPALSKKIRKLVKTLQGT